MTDYPLSPGDELAADVKAEWKAETTPFERVRAVMKRTYEPHSAAEIADRALTTPTTARKKLRMLVEDGFVEPTAAPDRDATLYRRSVASLVMEQARDILSEVGTEELASRINELHSEIRGYRAEIGVDTPEDAALQEADVDQGLLRQWQTTRRNLDIAKVALAIAQAEDTVREPTAA